MAAHFRKVRAERGERGRGTIRLLLVFLALAGVNVYVILVRPGNLGDVREQVTRIRAEAQVDADGPKKPTVPQRELPPDPREVAGVVGRGDTLTGLLRSRLPRAEADATSRALRDAGFDLVLHVGDAWRARRDDAGRLSQFELETPDGVWVVERTEDGLEARRGH